MPLKNWSTASAMILIGGMALAHGDAAPQPVDASALPDVGEEWLIENPYRADKVGEEVWAKAIEIGDSGYNQNCARCLGLGAVSGGLAPDVRYLEAEEYGDEWYVERFVHGYTQNGITKMPAFGELLGQKAAWAIRTYIETRPDNESVTEHTPAMAAVKEGLASGNTKPEEAIAVLADIANQIETLSGSPLSDSVAYRAVNVLEADPAAVDKAVEILTVGLSAAQ